MLLFRGIKITVKIKQGIDLKKLTIIPKIVFINLLGLNPFLEVTFSNTPRGKPTR